MAVTKFMNLTLPVVGKTIGPIWATMVNTAIEAIDNHDHSSGKGKLVPTSSLRISGDIDFTPSTTAYGVKNLSYARFTDLNAAGLPAPTNESVLYSWKNDLWWNHDSGTGAGTPVQITQNGVVASKTTYFETFTLQESRSTFSMGSYERYSFMAVQPAAGGTTINLPYTNAVGGGKFFIIQDVKGSASTRNITISPKSTNYIGGGALAADVVINTSYGHYWITSDGSTKWIVLSSN
jgi:hypothetical protein